MSDAAILEKMNQILQLELEGVNRYLHHSFMVFGFSRKPIVSYFRTQADESIQHAILLGEKIVARGGHPTIVTEARWEPEKHTVLEMLQINLEAEKRVLGEYAALLKLVPEDDVALEELVRGQIRAEQEHVEELEKYIRNPE
ncbi:MAG: ferritin-like domain-containing protein [Acidobacteriota bacterium]|jgi:bacterioferritin